MKKLLIVAMTLVMAVGFSFAETDQKQIMKERQEIAKMAKAELKTKVDKTTQKEAKRLAKEGW
ncbi:MAG: hypothetical protein J6P29_07115, partial [Acetobacter sp.]|nr:hypothetical protein [Acetobacter sp.]